MQPGRNCSVPPSIKLLSVPKDTTEKEISIWDDFGEQVLGKSLVIREEQAPFIWDAA